MDSQTLQELEKGLRVVTQALLDARNCADQGLNALNDIKQSARLKNLEWLKNQLHKKGETA